MTSATTLQPGPLLAPDVLRLVPHRSTCQDAGQVAAAMRQRLQVMHSSRGINTMIRNQVRNGSREANAKIRDQVTKGSPKINAKVRKQAGSAATQQPDPLAP